MKGLNLLILDLLGRLTGTAIPLVLIRSISSLKECVCEILINRFLAIEISDG